MKSFRPAVVATGLALLVSVFLATGCRKYPDGPTISLLSKEARISNNWKTSFVFRNNIDETARYEVYQLDFNKSGTFTWAIRPEGAAADFTLTGRWELASVKEQIRLEYTDPSAGATRLLFMDILKLYDDEMWVGFISEGDNYDLKLLPR